MRRQCRPGALREQSMSARRGCVSVATYVDPTKCGTTGSGRFPGYEPFDDAELGALAVLDCESLGLCGQQRASQEMLVGKRDGNSLERPLDRAHPCGTASNVVE